MSGNSTNGGIGFSANNSTMDARDVATGNVVVHGDNNIVYPYGLREEDTQDLSNIAAWLSSSLQAVNYTPAHDKACSQRAEGTGKWFFGAEEYARWVTSDGPRYLQCVGIPGAGKTTIASAVIEDLQDRFTHSSSIALFAYFRHDTQAVQTVPGVLASLLLQTITTRRQTSPAMRKLYEDYSPRLKAVPTSDRLTKVLKIELSAFQRIYIILDALDEFSLKDYSASNALIAQLHALNAKMLITSRHPVGGATKNTFSTVVIAAHADDIGAYIRSCSEGSLHDILERSPSLVDEIVDTIIEKSGKMFVIARLLVDSVLDLMTANEIRSALKTLPSGLTATYKLTMKRIQEQKPMLARLGMLAICWVYFAKRQLNVLELRHAVSFQQGMKAFSEDDLVSEERIYSACAGLLTVAKDEMGEPVYQFSHFTTTEFLDGHWQDYFPAGEQQIVETCLEYLSVTTSLLPLELTQRIAHSDWHDAYYDEEWQHHRTHAFALCDYAATHWGYHAKAIDEAFDHDLGSTFFGHPTSPYMVDADHTYIIPTFMMPPPRYWILYFSSLGLLQLLQKYTKPLLCPPQMRHDRQLPQEFSVIQDDFNQTALHFAASHGHLEVVQFILEHGNNLSPSEHSSQREEEVKLLFDNNLDSQEGLDCRTPLHLAIIFGHIEVAKMLLDRGADVNVLDDSHRSPLSWAVLAGGNSEVAVQLLLDRGAIVDQSDREKRAPISYAIDPWPQGQYRPSLKVVQLLLQHGSEVDVYRVDHEGKTPLERAREGEDRGIRDVLAEYARERPQKLVGTSTSALGNHPS